MPKPYDASAKTVIEASPAGWLRLAGYEPRGAVEVINVDLSAVTSAADYVLEVHDPAGIWLAHIEFVTARQHGLNQDLILRNALLHKRSGCPVETIVILLHPDAFQPELSGIYETRLQGRPRLILNYQVIKIYEHSAEEFLAGPAGIMPMAVLSQNVRDQEHVPAVLDRLHDRLTEELGENARLIKELWITAEIYLGLKFKGPEHKAWIKALTRGVLSVKDSIIYQDIFEEGEAAGFDEGQAAGLVRGRAELLMFLGTTNWGQPNEGEKVALEAITDIKRLDRMAVQLNRLSSWDQLLQIK